MFCFVLCRYGQEYIQESFLYHFIRRDTRHNFSVYFYVFYLLERTAYSKLLGILAFLPQAVLVLAAGLTLHQDLPLSWFVQTVIFVTFNKICTSQVSEGYKHVVRIYLRRFSRMFSEYSMSMCTHMHACVWLLDHWYAYLLYPWMSKNKHSICTY